MSLSPAIREFLATGLHFATIATIDPDGAARQAVIWYTADGDDVIINSRIGRRWPANLLRDPRISVSVTDSGDGYRWVGLTGLATPIHDQVVAQADIAGMARRYHADDPAKADRIIRAFETQERVSFRIRIVSAFDHLEDD